jgi:hypothetical protein
MLVAWYPLINDINDYSGNYNNLNMNNPANCISNKEGKLSKSYTFQNTDARLTSINKIPASNYISYAAWVYWTNNTRLRQGIVGYFNQSPTAGYNGVMEIDNANRLSICVPNRSGTQEIPLYSNGTIQQNVWTHIVVSISLLDGKCKFYINGVLDCEKQFANTVYPIA